MSTTTATAHYRELGDQLRKRREAAGLTCDQLGKAVGWSRAKVSRIERGYTELDGVDVIFYLGACKIWRGKAMDVMDLCHEAERKPPYWLSWHDEVPESLKSLIFHESTADKSTTYEPQLVPGLLQTEDYARAMIAGERWRRSATIDQRVRLRMDRQHVMYGLDASPFTFFMHEQALRQQVGSAAIMHEQLLQLVLVTAMSLVTVRVVPSSAADCWAFGRPFVMFEYDQHTPLVCLDNHASVLFLEDHDYVEPYQALVPAIAEFALDEGQSRALIADLANECDLGSERDADGRVEEEQP